jgi:hypothetical protein
VNNCSQSVQKKDDIINIIDDFNYDAQTEEYNIEYKKWRSNKDNPYAFNYVENKKEKTFMDGKGFIHEDPKSIEKITLSKIGFTAGISLLVYFFIDGIGGELIVWILNMFNINISSMLFSSEFMGNEWAVLAVNVFISLLKYIVPTFMLFKAFKMPFSISATTKATDKYEIVGGMSIAMILMVLISLVSKSSPLEFTSRTFFLSNQILYENYNLYAIFIYYLFEIFVVSILIEVFLHGSLLHVLRQFGDIFALACTTAISIIIVHSYAQCIPFALMTLVSGIFILRSGSIVAGFIIRIVFNIYFFSIAIINSNLNTSTSLTKSYFMSIFFLAGVLGCVVFARKHTRKVKLVNNSTYLNIYEKLSAFTISLPMVIWIALSAIFASINLFI